MFQNVRSSNNEKQSHKEERHGSVSNTVTLQIVSPVRMGNSKNPFLYQKMTQEILLKGLIELQNKLYDFILNILNLPSFIQNIQERLLRLENENQELR